MTAATALTAAQTATLHRLLERWPSLRILTVRQPWADLIVAGAKDVENRTWPPPSTLPQWYRCDRCTQRRRHDDLLYRGHWHGSHEGWATMTLDGPYPFRLGIHAAAKPDTAIASYRAADHLPSAVAWNPHPDRSRCGVLLGFVTVTGCHHDHEHWDEDAPFPFLVDTDQGWQCSSWAEPDVWHWTLTDPQPLDVPIPMRGMLGLWRLEFVEMAP